MDNLSIAAISGLQSRMLSLDLLANNLANSATSGYKIDREFYGLYSSDDSQTQWTAERARRCLLLKSNGPTFHRECST